ncbi:MAG TPA: TIGR02147 family protein [Chitinispirillaceae bacterium]|nr:TIGR02147 family protein [Chitinispirillaceae bacterium]
MITIFSYTDFRKYLTDYYDDRKRSDPRFSYRSLSDQSGINPGNFVKMLKGERNLTLVAAIKLSNPLGLNKRERDYFQAMIRFSQAKSHDEKKRCFEELIAFKESSVRILDAGYYMFYDKWYYTAVRETLSFFPLTDNNFAELGKTIIPGISVKQVENAVKLLLELNLIIKDANGCYQRTDAVLSTGNEMRSLILNNFVINTMKLAAQAINARVQETNLSTVTCSLSSDGFNLVQEEIRKCRRRILEIAKDSNTPNRVYQFNMQLFPLTERYDGRQP